MPEALIDSRLLERMTDAARHIELYRRLWGAAGCDPDPRRAPRLNKAVLRSSRIEDRVHDQRRGRRLTAERSSGSSGEPMTVYTDRSARRARRWAFLRALLACGYRPGQRCLLLTSRRDAPWLAIARWHYASIAADTESLARQLAGLAPRVLYGPLSTLELLAQRLIELRQRPPALRLVVSTAEQLTPRRLATLEQGFGAPVADFYGMTEFGLVAYRPPGNPIFVPARSSLILEFIGVPDDPAAERLIVTDLAEKTAPLIRYEIDDIVRRDPRRPGRPIVEFAGRTFDCIVRPDGRRLSPYRIDVALEHLPGLRAFEVVQQTDLSIDVTIDAAADDAERIRALVEQQLATVLGAGLRSRISTGTIPRGPAGSKFRAIRSLAGGNP